MTWFVEAQVALLWSIGKLNLLPPPTAQCDTGPLVSAMPELGDSTSSFIDSAVLRSLEALAQEEETIYDIHCSVTQAVRNGDVIPGGYDRDVVFYRHYGLAWITRYCGQEWDDVTPDT